MQSDLGTIIVVLICFGAVVMTVKLLVQGRIWRRLIENNMVQENLELPGLSMFEKDRLSWLKWGIVIVAFSLSLVLIHLLPDGLSEELKIGIPGIFVGAAFIVSHFISERAKDH